MGLSASQGRMLLLTARKSDLEYRAQQISQKRLVLSQQLEEIAMDYENATSNRQMKIALSLSNGSEDDVVNRTTNLTYAALVSGTLATISSSDSGIQAYERTEGQEYASTTAYRLVDAYGAIVVSSASEIPGIRNVENQFDTPQKNGYYWPTTQDSDNLENKEPTCYVYCKKTESSEKAAENSLEEFLNKNSDISTKDLSIDTNTGTIALKYKDKDGNEAIEYFKFDDKKDGYFKTSKDGFNANTSVHANIVRSKDEIPKSKKVSTEQLECVSTGADGKYTLRDENDVVIARYIVDETLKYGTTDASGATDGPNYLQDCLRNGKYLIEKATIDKEKDGNKVNWRSVSWDATSNISDSYYTEDDDKAKARYDRLQNQIQNQDKKLELELDNIETQRSAVKTEEESVQKVIDDNIEGSFNAFA